MALANEVEVLREVRYRGDTWVRTLALTDDAGQAYDLTGATLWFTLKLNLADADPGVIQHSTGSGIVVADPISGEAVHTVTATATAALVPGRYYFDYQLVEGAVVTTFIAGEMIVAADVTRTVV